MNETIRRRASRLFIGAVVFVILSAAVFTFWTRISFNRPVIINGTAVPPVPTLDAVQVAEGQRLYAQSCAQCHGAALEGAPNWRRRLADGSLASPPHDSSGHTWHHSDTLLTQIIALGGQAVYGDVAIKSNMPAFNDSLSSLEIAAVLDFIKSKWGKEQREFQWWTTFTQNEQ